MEEPAAVTTATLNCAALACCHHDRNELHAGSDCQNIPAEAGVELATNSLQACSSETAEDLVGMSLKTPAGLPKARESLENQCGHADLYR